MAGTILSKRLYKKGIDLIGFIYRGLIKPVMNRTPRKELLPYQWVVVGIVGLLMDIVKIPGTIIGSVIGRAKQFLLFRYI